MPAIAGAIVEYVTFAQLILAPMIFALSPGTNEKAKLGSLEASPETPLPWNTPPPTSTTPSSETDARFAHLENARLPTAAIRERLRPGDLRRAVSGGGRRRKDSGRGTRLHAAGSAGAGRQLPLRPAADGGEQQHEEDAEAHFGGATPLWEKNVVCAVKTVKGSL